MGTPMPLLVIAWHKQLIDFAGTYTKIVPLQLLEYAFGDRNALVEFLSGTNGVTVKVTFDAETQNPLEQQKQGWQAILDNFTTHVESAC